MWENIIIAIIILICAVYIGRRFYKNLTGKSSGCGCSCTGCDASDTKGKVSGRIGKTGDKGCCPP